MSEKITTLTITMDITQQDLYTFHDILTEIAPDEEWTNNQLLEIFSNLPRDIQLMAFQWGIMDTEFRDAAYTELLEQRRKNK